jgi:ornithine cyclodeaminase/alanine dehydrogenase-like protein (mu-crystallin family)
VSSRILVLSGSDVRQVVDPPSAVESQRVAYRAVARGSVSAVAGLSVADRGDDSLVFAVTGEIPGTTGVAFKLGCQMPANTARGLATVQATVVLADPETGEPLACLNGAAVTALRTAAGIAAAADALAAPGAATLGVFGSGTQAREAVRMISAVRPLAQVRIWSRSPERRRAVIAELAVDPAVEALLTAVSEPQLAARESEIVVTCTTSRTPVLAADWLSPGATVLTVGSYERDRREIDLSVTERAGGVFVDDLDKALAQCGPVAEAVESGVLDSREIGLIGAVLTGARPGRRDPGDVLVFHSVGLGVQDAALGWMAWQRARQEGLGRLVEF